MKLLLALALGALTLGLPALPSAGLAQSTTVAAPALAETTFYVENMTCALCPITVKTAMRGVEGVQSVEVDFDSRTAHVVFDPALTTAEAVAEASRNAGYPAEVRG